MLIAGIPLPRELEVNAPPTRLQTKKKNPQTTVRLPGLWAGLSKGDYYYLPEIHPTEGIDSMYTGSHSDQKNISGNCEK